MSQLASGAAVDRYESDRQRHTAVINFLDTTKDRRTEEESRGVVGATTVEYGQGGEEEYDDEYYYYEDEYEDGMSGDSEMEVPRGKGIFSNVFLCPFSQASQTETMGCNCCSFAFFFSLSCHVKQTPRPVCHPGG